MTEGLQVDWITEEEIQRLGLSEKEEHELNEILASGMSRETAFTNLSLRRSSKEPSNELSGVLHNRPNRLTIVVKHTGITSFPAIPAGEKTEDVTDGQFRFYEQDDTQPIGVNRKSPPPPESAWPPSVRKKQG